MRTILQSVFANTLVSILGLAFCLAAEAQPTIVSTVPDTGATGVPPSDPVVFTFSEAMNTANTTVQFFTPSPFAILATSNFWSSGDTVLTCTPTPAFPANNTIYWSATGQNPVGDPLSGTTGGFFSTGSSSGGGTGSGTNKFTTFSVGKVHLFDQYSTGSPVIDTNMPYEFAATTALASNRTASSISLTLPVSGVVTNLTQNPVQHEDFFLVTGSTNQTALDTTYQSGNYLFSVTGSSNQQVTVNLPPLAQPNAPHIANFAAAQSVNATQDFTLTWDAFTSGTSTDAVFVTIGSVFTSPRFEAPGSLTGTATSILIPANTLQANSNYNASVGFYRAVVTSNATYSTVAYIATVTDFTIVTGSGITLVLTNASWAANTFSFDVVGPAGASIVAERTASVSAPLWSQVLATNIPAGGKVHVPDPSSATNRFLFYRARPGP